MEKKNQLNYFIIKRLDNKEKSSNLSKIYDLSLLNESKEINHKINCLEKVNNQDYINYNNNKQLIKVIKKTILSINLYYKWKSIMFKDKLFTYHIFSLINSILILFLKNIASRNTEIKNKIFINYDNILSNNITFFNSTINNQTDTYSDLVNFLLTKKKISILEIISLFFIKNIGLALIWAIYVFKLKPKWDKTNNIIYKLTNYLLLCESYQNEKFSYCLLKDYSILVTKKEKFKKTYDYLTNSHLEYIYPPEKNIILYIISIIYDYDFKAFSSVDYYKLLPLEDLGVIIILLKYIQNSFDDKMIKLARRILSPIFITCLINICFFNNIDFYYIFSISFLFTILFLGYFIYMEYYNTYLGKIDKLINVYNSVLIKKKKYIYKKNDLILLLALKNNFYTKEQINHEMNKIMNS